MSNILYIVGDATEPDKFLSDVNIILHIVNDEGVMGAGIAKIISKKWPHVYQCYKELFSNNAYARATAQGQLQVVKIEKGFFVANLFGQSSIGPFYELQPVRYEAIEEGLIRLRERLRKIEKSRPVIHCGRIGCGLAGGSWSKIEDIINRVFDDFDVRFVVYDFPGSTFNP